jgi:carboxymethylenebutenolidase
MRNGLQAGTVTLKGADGAEIEAYAAYPVESDSPTSQAGKHGGVVVIHHMPGYDEASKEIVRTFASWGWSAICPNLHFRDAPGADSDDAAAASRAAGGVPDDRLIGDVAAAATYLREQSDSNGKVATIGFCSGGRQSVLAGTAVPLEAVVDCYGAFVLSRPAAESGMSVTSLEDRLPNLAAPVLGLFGAEDQYPAPEEVARLDAMLTELGKEHEFHTFEDAGHAFFAVDRPAYRQAAAVEGWRLVREFLGRHLGGDA